VKGDDRVHLFMHKGVQAAEILDISLFKSLSFVVFMLLRRLLM
jgi:hypothetical protein